MRKSDRTAGLSQSEIRAMTMECNKVNGINMAQGVCDLDIPVQIVQGAQKAMDDGYNIYMPCEGFPDLRKAVAERLKTQYDLRVDYEKEIFISAGATGAFYCICMTLFNPDDEVILFEPYYGYHAATLKAMGCRPVYSRLSPPDWTIDFESLNAVVTPKTKALVLNTPSNPSGKVFTREELLMIADFAETHDLTIITDEIYESFVYDGHKHIPPATVQGLSQRTITISGFSKIFSVTGWRLGYAVCSPDICRSASHMNDLIYVCAPSPLQVGAYHGLLELTPDYYKDIAKDHLVKRDLFCSALTNAGLTPFIPQGAYYVLADISCIPGAEDFQKVMHILEKTGVASVPGRAFYHDDAGKALARFCFAKKTDVLEEACERIARLKI